MMGNHASPFIKTYHQNRQQISGVWWYMTFMPYILQVFLVYPADAGQVKRKEQVLDLWPEMPKFVSMLSTA